MTPQEIRLAEMRLSRAKAIGAGISSVEWLRREQEWWVAEWKREPSMELVYMAPGWRKPDGWMKSTIRQFATLEDLRFSIERNLWPPKTGQKTAARISRLIEELDELGELGAKRTSPRPDA